MPVAQPANRLGKILDTIFQPLRIVRLAYSINSRRFPPVSVREAGVQTLGVKDQPYQGGEPRPRSMDGKGRWVDNVFVERLWCRLKYEEVYLKAYDTLAEARRSIGRYMPLFSFERRHQSLERRTPDAG